MSGREPVSLVEASRDRLRYTLAGGPSSRRDPLAWSIALLGAFIACYTVGWALGLGNPATASRFTSAAAVPGGVILTLIALRLRRTQRMDSRTRLAWSIIALALIGYGVGALIRAAMGSVAALQALWPLSLGLEFAAYPLAGIALAFIPQPPRTRSDLVLSRSAASGSESAATACEALR